MGSSAGDRSSPPSTRSGSRRSDRLSWADPSPAGASEAAGRRCWCSVAFTATSRRASRCSIELPARLPRGDATGVPVWLVPALNPDGLRGAARTPPATSTSTATSRPVRCRPRTRPAISRARPRCRSRRRAPWPTSSRGSRRARWWPCMRRLPASTTTGRPPTGRRRSRRPADGRPARTSATPRPARSVAGWGSIGDSQY